MTQLTPARFLEEFDAILETYPKNARPSISKDRDKYYEELSVCGAALEKIGVCNRPLKILDVGCGAGNFLLLAQRLFSNVQVFGVDRFIEFEPEQNRVMGTKTDVIKRMTSAGVTVSDDNPVTMDYFSGERFDLITCFDVIEHIPSGMPAFMKKMYSKVETGGFLVVSTPNQVHLWNRMKCLLGRNTWEDWSYYISCDQFFGHVRELTFGELQALASSISNNAKILGRTQQLNPASEFRMYRRVKTVVKFLIDRCSPKLSYSLFALLPK